MTQLGSSLLSRLLAADTGHHGPRIDCGAGHMAQFVGYRTKTIDTVLGQVGLRRAYYHCAACGRGIAPRDDELGVSGVSLSPGLRKITARVGATAPFAKAADLLADLAGIQLNPKRIERSAEADGAAAAARITTESVGIASGRVAVLADPVDRAKPPDKLYIAIDGTGVPMVGAAVAGRAGKYPDGRARTREVKLAAVFTQTTLDEAGRPVRDPNTTSYLASLATAAEFSTLVHAEARRRGADHIRQLVVLGDGAPWIWNLATAIAPEATPIVDLYHAREHLHALAAHLTAVLGQAHPHWLAARLADLDNGDIETLVTATERLHPHLPDDTARDTTKALGYFKTNAHRMRYGYFRAHGMFVGSGVIEAGCKSLVGQRLKLSGMRWNIPGATAILTLRTHQASGRFDQIWPQPHNQTTTRVTA
ncbi:MAG TPA: ISKra4 family transposase [Mycobacterium sp.]|nr:ISKra4 family transposase [Mycobacterium sp.]